MPNNNIRLIIEEKVPFVKGLFENFASVKYLPPEDITAEVVKEADGLIIRTRTRCDKNLLEDSAVKIIATATIGLDHIDIDYCTQRGIVVANAPGCNAPAVAQYVFSTLLHTVNRPLQSYTLGVVGVGHVGEIVARWGEAFEMKVLRCDPPRHDTEGGNQWVDLDTIATQADIITFHTPLTSGGLYPTHHLAGYDFFRKLKRAPIFINSARGSVVDSDALIKAKRHGLVGPIIIDCWENEPTINRQLLSLTHIATPHIAGYSQAGKIRATQVAVDAICSFFNLPTIKLDVVYPAPAATTVAKRDVIASYNPMPESRALKDDPDDFEKIRNNYELRAEVPDGHDPF